MQSPVEVERCGDHCFERIILRDLPILHKSSYNKELCLQSRLSKVLTIQATTMLLQRYQVEYSPEFAEGALRVPLTEPNLFLAFRENVMALRHACRIIIPAQRLWNEHQPQDDQSDEENKGLNLLGHPWKMASCSSKFAT